jgi:hypothetical protein
MYKNDILTGLQKIRDQVSGISKLVGQYFIAFGEKNCL